MSPAKRIARMAQRLGAAVGRAGESMAQKNTKKATRSTAKRPTAAKKATARKTAAKKPVAKKTTSKRTAAKKPVARKPAARKAPVKAPVEKAPEKTRTKSSEKKAATAPANAVDKPLREIDRRPPKPAARRPLISRPPEQPKPSPRPRPAKLDKAALGKIRAQLEQERAELQDRLRELEQDSFESSQSDMTGEAGFNDDFADAGTATFDRERDLSIRNNVLDLIDQVTRALRRIDEGLYGTCENCGNPIDAARIKAFPRVLLCLDCKRREERAR
ncbi:MAG: TraR/DksA C4-type zinc finger protein [Actinomycetota bacterium]